MWDERYSSSEYAYGKAPNTFLQAHAHLLPKINGGKVLSLAEGEGRNAVYLAQLGYDVTAVDGSAVGLDKARRLAQEKGVTVNWVHADLTDYDLTWQPWDAVISIFCHLPPLARTRVHRDVVNALKPDGVFLLEAYTPAQIHRDTGGGKDPHRLQTAQSLHAELAGLRFDHCVELEREILEGIYHTGIGSVVQLIATKV